MRALIASVTAAYLIGGLPVGPAGAAGFALREQSGAALGNAFAGATAGAEDLSFVFFNPAAAARQSGNQVVAVASGIRPRARPHNTSAATAGGTPIIGGSGGGNVARDQIVPAFYALWDATPELKLALSVTTPFGLETDYESGWAGRYHALTSRLRSVNLEPVAAYRFNDQVSAGVGLQLQYLDAKLTNAIDFGSLGAASGIGFALPAAQDGEARIEGDSLGLGATAGLLIEPVAGTRLGVAYRSQVHHELDGTSRLRLDQAGVGAALSAASGSFVDGGASAKLTLPESLSFGFHQAIGEGWAVMGEAAWTRWSRFDELRISFDNPAQADSVTEEDWHDSWFLAAGVTYRPSERLSLRLGLAHDQSPVPDRTRTPRIPGGSRTWIALGAGYRVLPNLSLSLSYTHIFVDDVALDLAAASPGNGARGSLSADYESAIDIVALQASLKF
jgi:long-chain fatty acid transport protein